MLPEAAYSDTVGLPVVQLVCGAGAVREGSCTLVMAAKRPLPVMPIQVPPACWSLPASRFGRSGQKLAGAVGRAWNSSRLAATTSGNSALTRCAKITRHIEKGSTGLRLIVHDSPVADNS